MTIYKVNTSTKIFTTVFSFFIFYLAVDYLLFNIEIHFLLKLPLFFVTITILIGTMCSVYASNISVDDKKIKRLQINIFSRLMLKDKKTVEILSLDWEEIEGLRANYIFYPESPIITLKPKRGLNKKKIEFLLGGMGGMPLELLKDILRHLSPNAKIDLYPYLEKMLKTEPDSKRKIIIIAILLGLMVIGGFLFVWFIWK